jgi:hypothetical protein
VTLIDELRERIGELAESSGLESVIASGRLRDAAERALRRAVEDARASGHTWQEIGDVLHTTRQAAFQRFGRPSTLEREHPCLTH